jgi:hypothetical protein
MAKAAEMTRKELLEVGVRMFQASCFESSSSRDANGQTWWTGKTCEGGGAYLTYLTHRMNQDTMTPAAVAREVEHRGFLSTARVLRAAYELELEDAAMKAYEGRIE